MNNEEMKEMKEMKKMKITEYKDKLETISLDDDDDIKQKKRDDNIEDMHTKLLNKDGSEEIKREIQYCFKIILVGDTNTGKTTICNTLINRNNKTMQYQPTIGIDFNSLVKKLYKNINVKIQLWDTAGQEKYRSIITSYFRNISSAIITYDVTNRASFMHVINWINDLDRFNNCSHEYKHPLLILATKTDLKRERNVSFDEGFELAQQYNAIFREVNSFVLKGPLEDGLMELLQSVYWIVDNEKRENIKSIPIAEPYTENLTINLNSPHAIAKIETQLIKCKGVKCMEIQKSPQELVEKQESPKICSKCVIS